MPFEVSLAALTTAQSALAVDLLQKIEALNLEVNKLQDARMAAQNEHMKSFKDEWTLKEIAVAEERNKATEAYRTLRLVNIDPY